MIQYVSFNFRINDTSFYWKKFSKYHHIIEYRRYFLKNNTHRNKFITNAFEAVKI